MRRATELHITVAMLALLLTSVRDTQVPRAASGSAGPMMMLLALLPLIVLGALAWQHHRATRGGEG